MSKMLRKSICIVVVLIMSVGILCACNKHENNYIFYDNIGDYINQQYMNENLIFNSNDLPNNKHFIIQNQTDFEKIFIGFPSEIDFDKQMILLKVDGFCTTPHQLSFVRLNIESQKLILEYSINCQGNEDCASTPYARFLALVLDRTEIIDFDFVLEK